MERLGKGKRIGIPLSEYKGNYLSTRESKLGQRKLFREAAWPSRWWWVTLPLPTPSCSSAGVAAPQPQDETQASSFICSSSRSRELTFST